MNCLPGRIAAIETCGSIALVDVDAVGLKLTATLVGAGALTDCWRPGMAVTLLFAETEVALAKNLSGLISMRNRLPGRIVALERGTVLTKVTLDIAGQRVVSVITTRSSHTLALQEGEPVEALVKANEMGVMPAASLVPGERG
ncbi:MAG: TOBE domain-containing protein [Herminiimonas sp.]|nr:TOBE domain-containing protein [Herminiimonas sp.]